MMISECINATVQKLQHAHVYFMLFFSNKSVISLDVSIDHVAVLVCDRVDAADPLILFSARRAAASIVLLWQAHPGGQAVHSDPEPAVTALAHALALPGVGDGAVGRLSHGLAHFAGLAYLA